MAIDKFTEITDRIITLLERGVKPWARPWSATEFQNLLSGHHYQGWNPLICAADMCLYGYKHPFFVGAGEAKAKGWKFKKGSKSTWIKVCQYPNQAGGKGRRDNRSYL